MIHFVERDDQHLGPPSDDGEAMAELERLRASGATYTVLASPSFWWRDSDPRFFAYPGERYTCAFEHPQMIVYDLSAMRVPSETRSTDSSYA